jgi:hypothetical protein
MGTLSPFLWFSCNFGIGRDHLQTFTLSTQVTLAICHLFQKMPQKGTTHFDDWSTGSGRLKFCTGDQAMKTGLSM